MARLFDLHIHTTKGSADSILTPEDLILEAERPGLQLGQAMVRRKHPPR